MGNLAKGKLPIELNLWNTPNAGTDGNYTKYDGSGGWASAKWPANFTLDFDNNKPIKQIRVLLFDGLGNSNQVDKRKYQFEIRLSEDGENFFTFFSNQKAGGNGWFIIDFVNEVEARFVQFVGLHNDTNGWIHLVEIEVFDEAPSLLPPSKNLQQVIAGGTLPNTKYIENLLQRALANAELDIQNILAQKEKAETATNKLVEEAALKTLVERFGAFKEAIDEGEENLKTWRNISIGLSIALVVLLLFFIICGTGNNLSEVLDKFGNRAETKAFGGGQAFLHYTMGLYLISRFVLLSLLLFLLSWSLRNYRAERHNLLVNSHKAMSLATALQLNSDENLKDTPLGVIILEAIRTVFSHQATGYDKSDSADSAGVQVVNNVKDLMK
jgi:hypothetical protein